MLLERYNARLDRKSGQNQVIDPSVLWAMIDHAELSGQETVLEIGAGTGNLTTILAQRAGKVIAVEKDQQLMRILQERLREYKNVKLFNCDALDMELPSFDKVVSNLPYQISSDITFKLLREKFEFAVLMYQAEFADRLVAAPGSADYSRLTVNVSYRASVELLDEVLPTAFLPQPKVNSRIVKMRPRDPPFKVLDEEIFSRVVRALFQHRRQRVRNALLRSFTEVFPDKHLIKTERRKSISEKITEQLANKRVVDLQPEEFGKIANLLTSP